MTVRTAWLLPGGAGPGQTREDTRLAPLGTMLPDGELTTRTGVIPGGDPFAAAGAGAMALQVGIGRGAVQGTTAQGAYPVALDAPETVSFDDGEALFGRIDTVVVRVYDGLYDVSGETIAVVEVVKGEATASPQPPPLLPACLPLWDVLVPAGTSAGVGGIAWGSALTDRRRYTVAVGGVVPAGTSADDGAYDGQYRDTGAWVERWSASRSQWEQQTVDGHRLVAGEAGKLLISFTAEASTVRNIVFAAPFSEVPIVSAGIVSGSGSTSRWGCRGINVTTTGFQVFVFAGESGTTGTWSNIPIQWSARVA